MAQYFRIYCGGGCLVALISRQYLTLLPSARSLVTIVERARLCLDFAGTLYLIHMILCTQYAGFPKNALWWLMAISSLATTSILGEFWYAP
jgi:hypothetical protein